MQRGLFVFLLLPLLLLAACNTASPTPVGSSIEITLAGTGQGTVTDTGGAITCGSQCSTNVVAGESLSLTATAETNSQFMGWGGVCVGSTDPVCTFTVETDTAVTASFEKIITKTGSLDVKIASSEADAEEYLNGNVNINSSDLEMFYDNEYGDNRVQTVGLHFSNLTIPVGATITKAYIQFTAAQEGDDPKVPQDAPVQLVIHGESGATATAFSSSPKNLSTRVTTTASANWAPDTWVTGEQTIANQTPDLTGILQEIVSDTAWTADNPVVFLISGEGTPATRSAESFDSNADAAPVLHVEYEYLGVASN